MQRALAEAEAAAARGEIPAGAVVLDAGGAAPAAAGHRADEVRDPTAALLQFHLPPGGDVAQVLRTADEMTMAARDLKR